ncbi:MAG: aldo/keto reductase [Deltaproteobacteria bacterium]|nr:aldo/keto reductase [Deltaproteobacteria bacterium]
MSLPRRRLGRTGEEVTILGLGGEGVLRTFGHERQAQAVIQAALEAGVTYFESARAYSGSEAYLGRGLKGHRRKIFLTSKSHARTRAEAEAHLETTLSHLQTDHLDLWQVHDVRTDGELEALAGPGGALEAFRRAREQGLTRFVGVTGHHAPRVLRRALELFDFDTVLLPVNPAEPSSRSFLPLAREALDRGLGVVGMKVLCRGLLPELRLAPVQDLVAYALSQPVSLVVIGADNVPQVKELAQAARDFAPLETEAVEFMESLASPFARGLMYYKP